MLLALCVLVYEFTDLDVLIVEKEYLVWRCALVYREKFQVEVRALGWGRYFTDLVIEKEKIRAVALCAGL